MSNVNVSTKVAKAVVENANARNAHYSELAAQIDAARKVESESAALEKMRIQMLNAESRAARANRIVVLSDADNATFSLFAAMHKSEAQRDAFFAKAIYVQDKIRATISALARNTSLASVTRNNTTRETLRVLLSTDSAERKTLLAELVARCNLTANTASSQVSSSLIALAHCNLITQDAATKRYSVNVSERERCEALAA